MTRKENFQLIALTVALVAILTLLLFPFRCFAQTSDDAPAVTTLKKGDVAPFAGSLLNPAAVAKILADKEYAKKVCDLDSSFALQKQQAKCDLNIANLKVELDIAKKRETTINTLKDDEIKRLTEMVVKSEKSSNYKWLYFVGGVVIGVGVSIGTAYAISHAVR